MQDRRCPVEGCRAGRGRGCSHTTTRCANCKGPHGARADACAAKKEARQLAWRWRSPPHQRREKEARQLAWRWRSPPHQRREKGPRAEAPEAPEYETPAAQGEEAGEAEVTATEEGGPAQAEEGMELGE